MKNFDKSKKKKKRKVKAERQEAKENIVKEPKQPKAPAVPKVEKGKVVGGDKPQQEKALQGQRYKRYNQRKGHQGK